MFKRLKYLLKKKFYRQSAIDSLNDLVADYSEPNNQRSEIWIENFKKLGIVIDQETVRLLEVEFKETLVYHPKKFLIQCEIKSEDDGFLLLTITEREEVHFFIIHYFDIQFLFKVLNGYIGLDTSIAQMLLNKIKNFF